MPANPYLSSTDVSFGWDMTHPPLLTVDSGTIVTIDAPDCSNGQLEARPTVEAFRDMDLSQLDPISGPIFVRGARPGDAIRVDILEIIPADWGWSAIYPDTGLLQDEFSEHWFHRWDLSSGVSAHFGDRIRLPIEPMLGIVGCTPRTHRTLPSVPPHHGGGNMDMKFTRAGNAVILPVEVEGGLVGLGDPHAAQGDGEVGGSGIECAASFSVRLTVIPDAGLRSPEFDIRMPLERPASASAGYVATTGLGESLYQAAQDAVAAMVTKIVKLTGITRTEAYSLCSLAVDLRISEAVNEPTYMVSAFLPRDILIG